MNMDADREFQREFAIAEGAESIEVRAEDGEGEFPLLWRRLTYNEADEIDFFRASD